MSNILKKAANLKIVSVIVGVILAAAIAVGIVCGVQGWGVFNQDALLKDSQTLTVSVNQYVYSSNLEKVESECEAALAKSGIAYEMKGQMSGDVSEIVYVFDKDVDLTAAKTALENKFADLIANNAEWKGTTVIVAMNSEEAIGTVAEGYLVRGIIAGVVLVALVFAYVAIRYGLYMGIVGGTATAVGALLTVALIILTRIPVTASVIYVIAVGALLTAVMSVIALNKIREEEGETIACNEILTLTALMGIAIILVGAIATNGVRWFALLSLLALIAAAVIGLLFVPAMYAPFKKVLDNKPVEGAYVGAEKTSTKVKKVYEKKAPVKEEVKTAPVEEAPLEEEEEAAEEVEEVEEATEETEAPAEEPATEEAPVEEVAAEETQD